MGQYFVSLCLFLFILYIFIIYLLINLLFSLLFSFSNSFLLMMLLGLAVCAYVQNRDKHIFWGIVSYKHHFKLILF